MEKSSANLTKKDKDRDRRYRQKYGITLEDYNKILELQGYKCAICGRKAETFPVSLAVDHYHFKIVTAIDKFTYPGLKWVAVADVMGTFVTQYAKTKKEAVEDVTRVALPLSVRGLLCPGLHGPAGTCCNRNLGRADNLPWLENALAYLKNPPARKILDLKR